MSWYREEWRRRKAMCFVNAAGGSTKDANFVIPPDLDDFWDNIDTDGYELRVTSGDGYTLLNYSVDDGSGGAFDKAARNGRVQVDGMTVPGTTDECVLLWLYYKSSSAQGDGSVATTIASAETGYIDRAEPSTWVTAAATPRPGVDRPTATFGKGTDDAAFLFLDVTGLLERRSTLFARRRHYEEPRAATYEVQDSGGTPDASLVDASKSRWIEMEEGTGGRRLILRLQVKAGTDGNQFTAVATIATAIPLQSGTHRTITGRAGFRVRNVLET